MTPRSHIAKTCLIAALTACGLLFVLAGLSTNRHAHAQVDRSGEAFKYASPVELQFSPDGKRLYVLCQGSDQLRVLDASTYAEIKRIPTGHIPRGLALSPDGSRLFVANSWDDTISVIDTASLEVTASWPVSAEPSGVYADRAGKHLFIANRISNDVAVLNAQTGEEEKRLAAGHGTGK